LVNKGEIFDIFYTHPRVLAGIEAVLGQSFKLSSLNYRAAKPSKGLQKLHVDWKNAVSEGVFKVCNSIWLLDDFTENNGSTRIVPKTHRSSVLPEEVMTDPNDKHPDEIRIIAPAVQCLYSIPMFGMAVQQIIQIEIVEVSIAISVRGSNLSKLTKKDISLKKH
jgi:ectoine hydroxylase-related dioxygenase (phytanoyl-CoA dioxygenase family)